MNHENSKTLLDEHIIEFEEQEILNIAKNDTSREKRKDVFTCVNYPLGKMCTNSYPSNSNNRTSREA